MFRRSLILLPLLAGLALPVAPALAGEDDGDGDFTLHQPRNCVSDSRAKVTVEGDDIDSVAFYVDGRRVKRVTQPTNRGTYVFAMRCASLSVGAHRGRAIVSSGDTRETLRFQMTRAGFSSPRFTG